MNRKSFKLTLDALSFYNNNLDRLESTLNCKFGDSFLTIIQDHVIYATALNFFTEDVDENNVTFCTVCDILYYWIFTCNFGKDTEKLIDFYVEDEGLDSEVKLSAITAENLYNVINRYVNPANTPKTVSIQC